MKFPAFSQLAGKSRATRGASFPLVQLLNGSVGCSHMSGLWKCGRMTAGPDGLRGSGPKQKSDV